MNIENKKIAVIGLGYVGLPLAAAFAEKYPVVGFDINQGRVSELKSGHDHTLELADDELKAVLVEVLESGNGLLPSCNAEDLASCNVFIVTVPTPTDKHNRPVLTPLVKASETVGKALKKGDIVIYESTVYPGVTEEECVPVLERVSGLKYNEDFFAGYSPERINPGDKEHTVKKILKVTSGSTPAIADEVDALYRSIIVAGTHKAPSIKVAEAAKVIENSQRDINIAFVNELAKIFNLMGIDTHDVLEAAGTKWNFLKFKPGLVGGHCIGVDPYYLAQKSQELGYHPEIILAGRRMNDGMGAYLAKEVVKCMIKKGLALRNARVLILGITFKENCPDVRNTKIVDVVAAFKDYGLIVDVFDPWANKEEVKSEYQIELIGRPVKESYDAVVLGVAHKEFEKLDITLFKKSLSVVYDVKGVLSSDLIDARL
jgi:UDP-N-acetyl-D-galactosamine dehydrogenase